MTSDSSPSIVEIDPDIYSIDAPCGPDFDVRALLILGTNFNLLVDTLARPADLEIIRPMLAKNDRPLLIVNSHADWDHWFGNAAFPDSPVIAHRLTKQFQVRNGKRSLTSLKRRDPHFFDGVVLRSATIIFDDRLDLDLGGITIELRHLPGHTPDSLAAFVPEREILFAADVAEDPIPLAGQRDVLDWASQLDDWSKRARVVVPSHGAISGPDLLKRNATYLRRLTKQRGIAPAELEGATSFYQRAHRNNLKRVRAKTR